MTGQTTAYAPTKGGTKMTLLPSYHEYKIGDTVYKVTSIFSEKSTLKEIYEKFVINSEKVLQNPDI